MISTETAYIFDLDGTLVDSFQDIANVMNSTRSKFNFPSLSMEVYRELIGLPVSSLLQDLSIPEFERDQIIAEFRSNLKIQISHGVSTYPEVPALLEFLRANGVEIGVATSKPSDLAFLTLQNSGLLEYFSVIQGTDNFLPKPNAEVVIRCISRMKSKKYLMVGDREEDIIAAKSAGIQAIGLSQTAHDENRLLNCGADLVFSSISDFLNYLLSQVN